MKPPVVDDEEAAALLVAAGAPKENPPADILASEDEELPPNEKPSPEIDPAAGLGASFAVAASLDLPEKSCSQLTQEVAFLSL